MEKTIDQELLELQELAKKHKRAPRRKTFEEKRMIVKAHLSNGVPIALLSEEFGVDRHWCPKKFRIAIPDHHSLALI